MLTATVLAVFYIPLFFVLVRRGFRDGMAKLRGRETGHHPPPTDDGPPNNPPRLKLS